jgi:AcrR family transcriptional regulator
MTAGQSVRRRPGGRSARVRAQVHQAVIDLLAEQSWDGVSIPLVAQRSGVHAATIYRRWGTLAVLIDDVVTEQLVESARLPDTGTLRGDLERYSVELAESLAGPKGTVLLRAAVLVTRPDRHVSLPTRGEHLQAMLDRASERGERAPSVFELLEGVMAPLYFHVLFFNRPADAEHAKALVARLLAAVDAQSRAGS